MYKHCGFSRKNTADCSFSRHFPLEMILSLQWVDRASVEFGPLKKDCWQQLLSVVPVLQYQTLFSLCIECLDCAVASLLGTQSKRPWFKVTCSIHLTTRCIARLTKQASLKKIPGRVWHLGARLHICVWSRGDMLFRLKGSGGWAGTTHQSASLETHVWAPGFSRF